MYNRCLLVHYNISGSAFWSGLSRYVLLQIGSVYTCVYVYIFYVVYVSNWAGSGCLTWMEQWEEVGQC